MNINSVPLIICNSDTLTNETFLGVCVTGGKAIRASYKRQSPGILGTLALKILASVMSIPVKTGLQSTCWDVSESLRGRKGVYSCFEAFLIHFPEGKSGDCWSLCLLLPFCHPTKFSMLIEGFIRIGSSCMSPLTLSFSPVYKHINILPILKNKTEKKTPQKPHTNLTLPFKFFPYL